MRIKGAADAATVETKSPPASAVLAEANIASVVNRDLAVIVFDTVPDDLGKLVVKADKLVTDLLTNFATARIEKEVKYLA
jgi:hypothetical protein